MRATISGRRVAAWALIAGIVMALAACSTPRRPAPVDDRSAGAPPAAAAPAPAASAPTAPPLPLAEYAGQPGYYTVKPGDTLHRIALEHGQSWRDIARWSGLANPNVIEVGQVLRVAPPAVATALPGPAVDSRPLPPRAAASAGAAAVPPPASAPPASPSPSPPAAAAAPPAAAASAAATESEVVWAWPASGPVLTAFDGARSKGLAIGGQAGDPVLAAADGRVVYAGSSLRGYGNLVIIKHNDAFISAYAHNRVLLVKEDQAVRRGQKIAEMGATDADRVQLHFEIRRHGKPVDPTQYLPPR